MDKENEPRTRVYKYVIQCVFFAITLMDPEMKREMPMFLCSRATSISIYVIIAISANFNGHPAVRIRLPVNSAAIHLSGMRIHGL